MRFGEWDFKVKSGICYISAKIGSIATKQKTNILIEHSASNGIIGFDVDHDIDFEFSRSDLEFAISKPKMVWLPRNKEQTYQLQFNPRMGPCVGILALTLTLNCQGQIWNMLYLR